MIIRRTYSNLNLIIIKFQHPCCYISTSVLSSNESLKLILRCIPNNLTIITHHEKSNWKNFDDNPDGSLLILCLCSRY